MEKIKYIVLDSTDDDMYDINQVTVIDDSEDFVGDDDFDKLGMAGGSFEANGFHYDVGDYIGDGMYNCVRSDGLEQVCSFDITRYTEVDDVGTKLVEFNGEEKF